jgi:hypothetical protein
MTTEQIQTTSALRSPLTIVGDTTAAACVGDSCAIPDHHEQAIVNARLDSDEV